jgi:hypothetical protein
LLTRGAAFRVTLQIGEQISVHASKSNAHRVIRLSATSSIEGQLNHGTHKRWSSKRRQPPRHSRTKQSASPKKWAALGFLPETRV